MKKQYNHYENIFLLHTLFSARNVRLDQITAATDFFPSTFPAEAIIDNIQTDTECREKFTSKHWKPSPVAEVHLMRCNESGVLECICPPEKELALSTSNTGRSRALRNDDPASVLL